MNVTPVGGSQGDGPLARPLGTARQPLRSRQYRPDRGPLPRLTSMKAQMSGIKSNIRVGSEVSKALALK
jgi:hypothetical protein